MKYSKYILFLFSLFMIAQASAQSRKAGPINSGFVFIDGKYIEPPYTVKRKGMTVYLNHIQIMQEQKVLTKEDFLLPKQEPGIPPKLQKYDDLDMMFSYKYKNTDYSQITAQLNYLNSHYKFEKSIKMAKNYFKSLPNIETTKGKGVLKVVTYSGDTGKIAISSGSARDFSKRFGPGGEGLPKRRKYIEYVNQQVQSIGSALKSGKIYFVFNDTTRFDDYARFYLSPRNGNKILRQLNSVCASDSLSFEQKKAYIKEKILKSNQSHPYLDKIINNFSVDEERVKSDDNNTTGHLKKDMDNLNKNDEKPKSNNKNVNMAYSPQNINMNIGSPDPWSNRYFLHTSFDNLCLNLSELTIDQGYANPVYYVDYTNGDDNWGNLTYDNFINFANAGINFWTSHGTEKIPGDEDLGYIEVIYANSTEPDVFDDWFNGNSQSGFGIVYDPSTPNNGWDGITTVPYVLVAYPEVAQQYWSDDISTNKSITVFGVCYSYQNGFVAACGSGGACFGYEVNASSSNVINTMNNRLFKRLNGTALDGGEFIRNTKDAMDDLTSIDGFKMYPSNAVISLCPTITEKYPTENATVASSVPSGHIKFDTWCDAGQSANNALSFDVQNGDISDDFVVSWDGSDNKSNQINFQWSGTYGEVTVNVNPEYIRAYNGGQRLDYDGVTPNADMGSYTFTVDDDIPTEAPVADFTYTMDDTYSPNYTVNFEDQSENSPNEWHWDFGDGYESTSQNPNHSYFDYGTFDVILTATNNVGSDTETKTITIEQQEDDPNEFDITCENIPTTANVNQPIVSSCEVWSGNPPYQYEFNAIVDNNTIHTENYDNVWAENKQTQYSFDEISVSHKLCWTITDNNNNSESCCNTIDLIEDEGESPFDANFNVVGEYGEYCKYNVFDINTTVSFKDMSYSTDENSCPIKRWEWIFDWETHNDDCPWWAGAANDCHWDDEYFDYQTTVSHTYETIGKKTIRLLVSGIDYVPTFWSNWTEANDDGCPHYAQYWGGVIVIDCELTSTYFPSPFSIGFTNAVRSDWAYENWGGPVYIYGGTFEFNGLANNYLSQAPTTLSACNEIIINGDVEFVASGDNELVLEINDDPCLQGGSKSSINYANNKVEKPDKNDSKWQCYPNPVKDKLNVSVMLENKQDLHFKILNAQGQVIAYHNRKNVVPGKYLFRVDLSKYQPGMYFISINLNHQNNTQKIIKQ